MMRLFACCALTAHVPPFCCQAIEQLLGTSSPEMEGLLTVRAGFDYFAGDREYYRLPGACRASRRAAALCAPAAAAAAALS